MITRPGTPRQTVTASAPQRPQRRPIVIYDSGVGGLTVARQLMRHRPDDDLLYVADNGWFPYGDKTDLALHARVSSILDTLVEQARPRAIVIACNTASTAIAAALEDMIVGVPIFTVLPPVRQAVLDTPDGTIALLATPSTVRHPLVRGLIDRYAAPGQIKLLSSMALVHLAERKLGGEPVTAAQVAGALDEVLPAAERSQVEGVILGCTHFPWLRDQLRAGFPAARVWSDPARQTAQTLMCRVPSQRSGAGAGPGGRALLLTSEHNRNGLRKTFARHGFTAEFALPAFGRSAEARVLETVA